MSRELLNNFSFERGLPPDFPPAGYISEPGFLQGWTVLPGSADIEIVQSPYPPRSANQISSINGTHFIDSQASPGGIDISQQFRVPRTNEQTTQIDVKIGAAWQNINGAATNPADKLVITIDGKEVKTLGLSDFQGPPHGQADTRDLVSNHFLVFDEKVFVAPGRHTIEVHDVGPVGNVGIAIDFVSIHAMGGGIV